MPIAAEQNVFVNNDRNDYKVFFTATSNEPNARIYFRIEEDNSSYWMDNVKFCKAKVEIINEDSIKFVYNPSNIYAVHSSCNHLYCKGR